jgi:hypothetical protein
VPEDEKFAEMMKTIAAALHEDFKHRPTSGGKVCAACGARDRPLA